MFKKFVNTNVKLVTTKPKLVLIGALLLTILAGFLLTGLDIELNWVALAPKGHPAVKEYGEIIDDFPAVNNMIIIIEGDDKKEISAVVEEMTEDILALEDYVGSVTVGIDRDFILDYGLLLASDEEAEGMAYALMDNNLDAFLGIMSLYKSTDMMTEEIEEDLKKLIQQFDSIDHEDAIKDILAGDTLMTDFEGMVMMTVQPTFDILDLQKLEPGVGAIEDIIADAENKYKSTTIGVTGMHVVARDETASIESDSSLTTLIALVAIFVLLYVAFKAITAPILAFIPLIIGIVWTIGLAEIFIGRLNMITAFSAAMLLGLGIDYAIHMYTSYTERIATGIDKKVAMDHAISITGPGIITGALTTAVAFFALNFSQLELLSELGTIMGLGIISTLLSVFWILPSLIVLKKDKKKKKINGHYPWIGHIAMFSKNNKVPVIIVLAVLTVFMLNAARDVEFDMNLMNLEPEGLDSIELMEHMVEEYDISADSFAVRVNTLDEVYEKHEAFSKLDGVKEVVSVASLIPEKDEMDERIKLIESLPMMDIPFRVSEEAVYQSLLESLAIDTEFKIDEEALKSFYNDYQEIAKNMLAVEALTPDSLPDSYKKQLISEDGDYYLISIYPDFDIWSNLDTEKGEKFFEDIYGVDEKMTGTPIFMKVLFDSAGEEMLMIGSLLMVILVVILMLHFRSIKYTLFALTPLALTMIFTVGTMSLIDLKFNMMNFLSILLIIGIGIDDGVHILHHYKTGLTKLHYLFSSVGKAILMTTMTTVFGFGSLIFSSYRGIASLGAALSIGVLYAFVMTVIVLPLLLKEKGA